MDRPIICRESYVGETGKSMKALELAVVREGCWRKIAISLIDPDRLICHPAATRHAAETSRIAVRGQSRYDSRKPDQLRAHCTWDKICGLECRSAHGNSDGPRIRASLAG